MAVGFCCCSFSVNKRSLLALGVKLLAAGPLPCCPLRLLSPHPSLSNLPATRRAARQPRVCERGAPRNPAGNLAVYDPTPGSRAAAGGTGGKGKGAALTLVEDVHARLVGTDDLQGFGVRGEDPDYAPVVRHQPLGRLLLRDAFWHYQPVLDFKFGGPVEGGVINLCRDRETCLESWAAHPAGGEWALGPEPGSPGH